LLPGGSRRIGRLEDNLYRVNWERGDKEMGDKEMGDEGA
jgi:hypothetical protein